MYNFFIKIKKIFINKEERIFIKKNLSNYKENKLDNNKETIVYIAHPDHFFLLYWKILIKQIFRKEKYNSIAIWPLSIIKPTKNIKYKIVEKFFRLSQDLFQHFLKKKWFLLYKIIGVQKIFEVDNFNDYFNKKEIDIKVNNLLNKIKNNSDILKIELDNVIIGDLIYDSYIRYRSEPTVNISDLAFLRKILHQAIITFNLLNYLCRRFNISNCFTVYCVYLQFGIPVRFFLNNKINVYSWPSFSNNLRKIDPNYPFGENVKNFKKQFSVFKNKKKKIKLAKFELSKKFKNNLDASIKLYPSKNFKRLRDEKILNNLNGVVFLQCFYDAPHYYGVDCIFNDHYLWTIYTLDLINKHNLKIAIKTHPFALEASKKIYEKLKYKYRSLIWFPDEISNIEIIKNKNINFFISNQGSILYEASYFGKTAISAGVNRTSSYNFSYNPKKLKDYKNLILNPKKKIITKKNLLEICEVYYQSFLHDEKMPFNTIVKKIKLMNYHYRSNSKLYMNLNYFDKKIYKNLI
jgi:hypothetical protein